MLKIIQINVEKNLHVRCHFNNGEIKVIDILPILNNHSKLKGIQKLYQQEFFEKVEIGEFGELVWRNCIELDHDGQSQLWDYDISPEFVYQLSLLENKLMQV